MSRLFVILSFLMGAVILSSNYLVQFPIKYYDLEEILTYGAFSYPIAFLITDLANRGFGKIIARKIVYIGFFLGVFFTIFFSTNFSDLISVRIAIGSGTAFIIAQSIDIQIFDKLRKKQWFVAPLVFSFVGSTVDTFFFFFHTPLCICHFLKIRPILAHKHIFAKSQTLFTNREFPILNF